MSPPRKDTIPNQDNKLLDSIKINALHQKYLHFFLEIKHKQTRKMMIIPKLQILYNLKKMIRNILNKMILFQKGKTRKIQTMMTNTKKILENIRMVMNVLIILKLQILCVMKVLSTTTQKIRYNYVCYLDTWLPYWVLHTPKA